MSLHFPKSFLFGAATSSYQIEGSPLADGAVPSIWHTFSHTPGNTAFGQTGDHACNHYRHWKADVGLMKELGLQAYRFSISWSRIVTDSQGTVNEAGLSFYEKLIEELLEAGILPFVTLYHWDLPQYLQDLGGWANPQIVDHFRYYTEVLGQRLGDRVNDWITLNEPWVFLNHGFISGEHAPGAKDPETARLAFKHIVEAQAAAYHALKNMDASASVGPACNFTWYTPANDSPADQAAARRLFDYENRLFTDTWLHGNLPEIYHTVFQTSESPWTSQELEAIRHTPDFIGINYYTRRVVTHHEKNRLRASTNPSNRSVTDMGWEIYPQGLTKMLLWLQKQYNLPMFITENGCACSDSAGGNNLADEMRIDYFKHHLQACHRALRGGVDLRGYFAWSLLDNFEWAWGYTKRFGLIHVDFESDRRTFKKSGHYYRDVINKHRRQLLAPTE